MMERRFPLRQQRSLNEIIEAALNIYGQNFQPLFLIAAVVVPLGVAGAVFQNTIDDDAASLAILLALSVAQIVVNLLAGAALIVALADIDGGRPAEFSRAYDVAFEKVGTLVQAIVRVMFHVGLFAITIIGIPWAIQRAVRWLFIQQAIILDQAEAEAALSTSAAAVRGSWWRTFGIWIVISLILIVPTNVVGLFVLSAPAVVSGTVSAAANALVLPFGVTAITLLYMDLKVRREAESASIEEEGANT